MHIEPNLQSIEAHQMALVAAAMALDLDWDGDHPSRRTKDSWRRFADHLPKELADPDARERLDQEQVYFQAFVLERCLDGARTANAELTQTLFDAWDYYLRTLPDAHGVRFDYQTWRTRNAQYSQAWNDGADRRRENAGGIKNPFFPIAIYLIETVCSLKADAMAVLPITLAAAEKASSFLSASSKRIVDSA